MEFKFPPIYVLKAKFERNPDELLRVERELGNAKYDPQETRLFIGKETTKGRIRYELRTLGIYTEDVTWSTSVTHADEKSDGYSQDCEPKPAKKRRKATTFDYDREVISLDTDSDTPPSSTSPAEESADCSRRARESEQTTTSGQNSDRDTVKVFRLGWFKDSVKANKLLPSDSYLVYEGRVVPKPHLQVAAPAQLADRTSILSRARADTPPPASQRSGTSRYHKKTSSQTAPAFYHETTEDHENDANLPALPDFLQTTYSCQRPTPMHGPNDEFLRLLKIIKKARIIDGEEQTRHSYHSAIASIAAYPFTITSPMEIHRLPSCGDKYASLWYEWSQSGHIQEVDTILEDPRMNILNIFYDIYDVAATTAIKFYNKGWKDLDDVVEHGWVSLSRSQQIGVKLYDDFQIRIPRAEVEKIGQIVLDHANKFRPGFQMVICGGYRRGKRDSGDVDVMLSHPDEDATEDLIRDLLNSLEENEYITHQLQVSSRTSDRGQAPLEWRGSMNSSHAGFDSLDKGLVVWQDPVWPTKAEDLKRNPKAKNPNVHRRVDILITPWKTAGCAVLGWSGATTFEIDLRRYCRHEKNVKFDSSGIRRLDDGAWVDYEKGGLDMIEKEKLVFEGLGLVWREPTMRCTD
ncbi:related to DNA polymerase Tdt-N [Rhynchosporium secalis]|uniref:DNA polymerase n=1 Tax=Rhynchosporium secalis TaxID=38038 RepID=A0A1E1MHN8_RHYSE|nr:related to DNA polymerase Tdt-N [Rhynchosporium secalis]